MKKKTLARLNEDHKKLKSMPCRLDLNNARDSELKAYLSEFIHHINDVANHFTTDENEVSLGNWNSEAWWVHDCKYPLYVAVGGRDYYIDDVPNIPFMDEYLEQLLQSLHKAITTGVLDYIVYPDVKKDNMVGYKTYEKINGKWKGIRYTKSGNNY